MKNLRKRIFALMAVTCVAFASFTSCSDSESDGGDKSSKSEESSEEPNKVVPFQFGGDSDDEDDGITMEGVKINEDDPVKNDHEDPKKKKDNESSEDGEEETEPKSTGYTAGQPVTEIVPVTEAGGQPVTEENGQQATEVKTITNGSSSNNNSNANNNNANADNGNSGNNSNDNNSAGTNKDADYVSNTKGKYAMWIDISKDENFVFNDSFIKVEFKVKDDAPEGTYDIAIEPDLSTIDAKTIVPTIMNGSVKVGSGQADSVDIVSMTDFTMYGDKVSAKPGETIEFCINMKNNPGLAAFVVWFYYDSNALEIIDCYPDGEFAEISSNNAQIGDQ